MDDDIRHLLRSIVQRIDAQIPRLDAIDTELKAARGEARAAREEARAARDEARAARVDIRTLAESVAIIAGIQADTSKSLGELATQFATMNERLSRMVEGSVRARTEDAQRYTALETRIAELELQVRALTAERGS